MMATKPSYIDLRSKVLGGNAHTSPFLQGFLSPRTHMVGKIPPELSPLDAFAAQSRLLAQQLEENSYGENPMSPLPPATVVNSLNQEQSEYFSSATLKSVDDRPISPANPLSGQKTKIEAPGYRHMSIHPTLCGPSDVNYTEIMDPTSFDAITSEISNIQQLPSSSSFSILQSSPTENKFQHIYSRSNTDLTRHKKKIPRTEVRHSSTSRPLGLVPNVKNSASRSPSPYSLSTDSSDDDRNSKHTYSIPLHTDPSENNNPSSNSNPTSIPSRRTSSISSDSSFNAVRISHRPSPFNFSRPIARASIPHELPLKLLSSNSNESTPTLVDDTESMPPTTCSDTFSDASVENSPAPYIYAKYALPRGKTLKKNSLVFQGISPAQNPSTSKSDHESLSTPEFYRPASSTFSNKVFSPFSQISSPSFEPPRPSTSSNISNKPRFDAHPLSSERNKSNVELVSSLNTPSTDSSSSLKSKSQVSLASSACLTATEHVEKAIEFHQAGALSKSTYHLRLAARMSHPTGMLLYALACRHGWGMRPNQREGVAWLRKAADETGLGVADDETMMQAGKQVDVTQMKSKKAQFALSIYELGVSHMNGWGIEQDKALGLRCFEIAGSWGDADAMAEAGFCYAQGVGCKKDLKKSARFYRAAEAKGVNMIGNSWIYKAKYNEEPKNDEIQNGRDRSSTSSSKDTTKSNDNHKSRSRGIFRRSKAVQA
ncbi:putative cell cycle inhibitor nif1 [Golovinomyces cichoracearum]|uniref:Putative cell cycle inhibitor nif1 n=1 Tax=Golovinomyces cichoracearum TaxID=62708 RepID=A0A420H7E7_9PEZI|nr:putative cell cycle inhibitor nif1 [Golovinomyces cichoracearum]